MAKPRWDIFICHASEDKRDVVIPLANMLSERGVRVWIDDSEIRLGDSIRQKIEEGLAKSRFGAVVLSRRFFAKAWANAELSALFARQMAESGVLLPIWHGVSLEDVRVALPLLADIRAAVTDHGIKTVAEQLYRIIRQAAGRHRPGVPLFAGKLTKRALMALPEQSILTSNCYDNRMQPKVLEVVPPLVDREVLWRKIRDANLSGTQFYAFSDASEYRIYVARRSAMMDA